MEMEDLKIVYVLTNPAMPGLVKIGYTGKNDANTRIGQLYTTGVPVPFELEFACKVKNAEEVEKALHIAFSPYRINPKREFFQIEPSQAIAILQLLHEDATKEVVQQPSNIDQQSIAAAQQMKNRRPNLNFEEMGIPIGSELKSVHSDDFVTVVTPKKVKFGEEEMSLTAATRQILGIGYSVAPNSHWTYNGMHLNEIYNEIYGETE
ncbi:GIY-YIG nuclease family protein [Sphaerospermopsis torques-reginae]|uniref:GIY-YIG nuclease family protein n=1 Tax=Sphaerospermopsis torques-reginae ITEP-024 TaxID=984208 RepID=A0ABX8WVL7_9CYAN|nr:GIY-YIG nuclease family protein [Sphaerospermopsis torques-reginae]QYX30460.1 GIY-YIG nuclease family protein [Sphaerospermopsis torques-reginae ITEP-024]